MRTATATLCMGLTLAVAGCQNETPDSATKPSKTVVVLFDMSASTATDATRQAYVSGFNQVADQFATGDALVGGWITDNSASELELPVNVVLDLAPASGRSLVDEANRLEAVRRADNEREEAKRLMEERLLAAGRRIMRTDILGSLEQAARVFQTYRRNRNVLVLFSDMVQDSSELNLEKTNLSGPQINRLVASLSTRGRIPDLAGIEVFCVGASQLDAARSRLIQQFWSAYFQAAKADFRPERYGAALIKFE